MSGPVLPLCGGKMDELADADVHHVLCWSDTKVEAPVALPAYPADRVGPHYRDAMDATVVLKNIHGEVGLHMSKLFAGQSSANQNPKDALVLFQCATALRPGYRSCFRIQSRSRRSC